MTTVPVMLKPFLPQLQRTFIKCLTEAESEKVREYAGMCLDSFIELQPRLDPLTSELCTSIKSTSDVLIQCSLFEGLSKLVSVLSETKAITEANQAMVIAQCEEYMDTSNGKNYLYSLDSCLDKLLKCATKCMVLCSKHIGEKGINVNAILMKEGVVSLFFLDAMSENRFESMNEKYAVASLATLKRWLVAEIDEQYLNTAIKISDLYVEGKIEAVEIMHTLVIVLEKDPRVTVKKEIVLLFQKYAKEDYKVCYQFGFINLCQSIKHMTDKLVTLLIGYGRERLLSLKLASERALVHILQIHSDPSVLELYLKTADTNKSKLVSDYCKRVLSKVTDA